MTDAALQLRLLGFELPDVVACLVDKRERIRWNVRAVDRLVGEYNGVLDRMDGSAVSELRTGHGRVVFVSPASYNPRRIRPAMLREPFDSPEIRS